MSEGEFVGKQKTVVIGLDGATFTVLKPMMEKGYLPNLSNMIKDGVHGPLESTMPPFSAAAWASFMTGKNPGKHGLFDFRAPVMISPERPLTNATSIRSKTIWGILSDAGKKVGVINVPMTYPPERVNGFMIGGMVASGMEEKCFYPKELYQETIRAIGEYPPEPDWDWYRENGTRMASSPVIQRLIGEVSHLSQKRGEAALYLMEQFDWDVFMVVFTSVDRLQHFAWKYLDPGHKEYKPEEAEKYLESLAGYFSGLDKMIGQIVQSAGKETHTIVMSDHGFGPQYKKFYINNWLAEKGFLGLLENKRKWRRHLRRFDISRIRRFLPRSIDKKIRGNFTVFNCIDWSRTEAYGGTSSEQGIFINVKGREPYGIVETGRQYEDVVDHVCEELERLTDPETGKQVVNKVFRRDELYSGPYVDYGPDIVFELKGMSYLTKENIGHHALFESSGFESGSHRREGILIMNGPNCKQGVECQGASILDLAPTVLYLSGLPVDKDMDGSVLTGWLDDKFVERNPIQAQRLETTFDGDEIRAVYSDSESEEIESMLQGLGYID
ncbi:MAG: alkaline phosphatase family protein [Deltaproteobacteria bacterium]|nr:alkaline phosphatase family protein [Deltaproteobacteria bacterium]